MLKQMSLNKLNIIGFILCVLLLHSCENEDMKVSHQKLLHRMHSANLEGFRGVSFFIRSFDSKDEITIFISTKEFTSGPLRFKIKNNQIIDVDSNLIRKEHNYDLNYLKRLTPIFLKLKIIGINYQENDIYIYSNFSQTPTLLKTKDINSKKKFGLKNWSKTKFNNWYYLNL